KCEDVPAIFRLWIQMQEIDQVYKHLNNCKAKHYSSRRSRCEIPIHRQHERNNGEYNRQNEANQIRFDASMCGLIMCFVSRTHHNTPSKYTRVKTPIQMMSRKCQKRLRHITRVRFFSV